MRFKEALNKGGIRPCRSPVSGETQCGLSRKLILDQRFLKRLSWIGVAAVSVALCNAASAQSSTKVVRWIVPFPPGGIVDVMARLLAPRLQTALGQAIIVENRVGAGGMIAAEFVAKGPPDGSLLLIAGQSVPVAPSLFKNLKFSPFRDLAAVVQVGYTPQVLVVRQDHPAKSVKDIIEMARRTPGKLNYASAGIGSVPHMTSEMFKMLTGTEIVHIPFKGSGDSVPAMLSGQVDINFDNLQGSLALIQSGKYRVLAVASRNREALIPAVPTMIESGVPDFVVSTWNAVWTTGGTPPDTVQRYESELRRILAQPEVGAAIQKVGMQVTNLGSRETAKLVEDEGAHWDNILKRVGVQPD